MQKGLLSHSTVLFSIEENICTDCEIKKPPPPDPGTHQLFGIPLNHPDWPGHSEYGDQYGCAQDGYQHGCAQDGDHGHLHGNVQCYPWPTGPRIQHHHRDQGIGEYMHPTGEKHTQMYDELYDPTPLPAVDKHYTTNYYRIDDPVGNVITPEEITKCRDTMFGPVGIGTQEEKNNIYVPNYRYKEWAQQPQFEILKQNEMTSSVCRMPEVDARHYDFYHQVRMNRPTPPLKGAILFGTCGAIPLPRNDSNFTVQQSML